MNPAATAQGEAWERALRQRVGVLLRAVQAGDDAPPALRMKAEGFAEAGLALGFATPATLAQLLDSLYREVFGAAIAQLFPFDAVQCVDAASGRVTLPLAMRRAPVHAGAAASGRGG